MGAEAFRSDAGSLDQAGVAGERLLREGETCWRRVRARRLSVIADAAAYFAVAKQAILSARHTVFLIGWDFDLRIKLERVDPAPDVPDALGDLLRHVISARPGLKIYVLRWDLAFFKFPFRAVLPLKILDWLAGKRLDLRADRAHPPGASHHQKIVVIDDCLAFCGGIDMTEKRWDTPEHSDDNPLRVNPAGTPTEPWHDATTCLDGEAAAALGELARDRWRKATGERLPPGKPAEPCWPKGLAVDFHDVSVGISRTEPAADADQDETRQDETRQDIREIEALYLAAIRSARRSIYIETQYFASHRVAAAIEERLREADGPEIVVINPRTADGWLEEQVMGAARVTLLHRLKAADPQRRFRIYAPVTAGRQDIYVHAKIMIVDDRFLKVGSSNLNNRSMGLDTECDLAIDACEAAQGQEGIRRKIIAIRNGLLAEHLATSPAEVDAAMARCGGSLIAAIEALRRPDGRSLVPLEVAPPGENEQALFDSQALDPEGPEAISEIFRRGRHVPVVNRVVTAGIAAAGLIGLGLAVRALGAGRAARRAARRRR